MSKNSLLLLLGITLIFEHSLSTHLEASDLFLNSDDDQAWVVGRHVSDIKPGGAITNEDFICTVIHIDDDSDAGPNRVKAKMWVYSGVHTDPTTSKKYYTNKVELTAGGELEGTVAPTLGQGKLRRQTLVLKGKVGLQHIKVWITARKQRGTTQPILFCGYLISNTPIGEIETDTDCTEPPTEDVLVEETYVPTAEDPTTEPAYAP